MHPGKVGRACFGRRAIRCGRAETNKVPRSRREATFIKLGARCAPGHRQPCQIMSNIGASLSCLTKRSVTDKGPFSTRAGRQQEGRQAKVGAEVQAAVLHLQIILLDA